MENRFTHEGKTYEITGVRAPREGELCLLGDGVIAHHARNGAIPGLRAIVRLVEPVSPFEGEGKTYVDADGDRLVIRLAVLTAMEGQLLMTTESKHGSGCTAVVDPLALLNDLGLHFNAKLAETEARFGGPVKVPA